MWLIPIGIAIALMLALGGRRRDSASPPASVPPAGEPLPSAPLVTSEEIEQAIDTDEDQPPPVLSSSPLGSPFGGVSDGQWSQLVQWSRQGKPNTITKAGNLGIYLLGIPLLVDLGLMRDPRQIVRDGGKRWEADWIPPHTLASFFADPQLQYATWRKHVIRLASWIKAKHAGELGAIADGKPATLSGLLAVALMAGPSGLAAWLAETADKRHVSTTKAYREVNGVF